MHRYLQGNHQASPASASLELAPSTTSLDRFVWCTTSAFDLECLQYERIQWKQTKEGKHREQVVYTDFFLIVWHSL